MSAPETKSTDVIDNTAMPLSNQLLLTAEGTVGINEAASFIWNGSHSFTRSIIFSRNQVFQTFALTCEGEQNGDILVYQREKNGWHRLNGGKNGLILSYSRNGASWGLADLRSSV